MFFSKSMTIGDEELASVALPAAGMARAETDPQAEFVERLKARDAAAFDELTQRHAAEVYGLLFRLTQDQEEARDLTQETFLSALRGIERFRGDAHLRTWLFRIAINESRNRFRWWKRRRRDLTISLDVTIGDSEQTLGETFAANGLDPEQTALRRERRRRLWATLAELPEIFREAVVLCDIQGMTYDEIAATLEVNIGTVKSRIARGRDELRKRLKDL